LEHNLKGGCDVRAVCGEQSKKQKTLLFTSTWNVFFLGHFFANRYRKSTKQSHASAYITSVQSRTNTVHN